MYINNSSVKTKIYIYFLLCNDIIILELKSICQLENTRKIWLLYNAYIKTVSEKSVRSLVLWYIEKEYQLGEIGMWYIYLQRFYLNIIQIAKFLDYL